jgi:signal transduction histidine kinase
MPKRVSKLLNLKNPRASIAFFLLFASVAGRGIFDFSGQEYRYIVFSILFIFLALSVTPTLIASKIRPYPDIYLGLQSLCIVVLLLLPPSEDYFSILYVCLTIQAVSYFSIRKGFVWIAIFSILLFAALIYAQGPKAGALFFPVPLAGCILTGLYVMTARKALDEKNKSQELLVELQKAYRKLELYTRHAETFAATEERNRLARELHDSVTQKLFSMTLSAEAARMIYDKDPAGVVTLLQRLQELSHDSLDEMRVLLKKLRPKTISHEGLIPALEQHIRERKDTDGLAVDLVVEGGSRSTSPHIEEPLFRVVQEALNNVVKHSGANSARIVLRLEKELLSLRIEDMGRGFNQAETEHGAAHLGLSSMRERVSIMGGKFNIESEPGQGTRIYVEVPTIPGGIINGP